MGYKFKKWNLYKAEVHQPNGIIKTLYFFTRWKPRKGIPCDLPSGCTVALNERTGLPYLVNNCHISNYMEILSN